VGAHLPLPGLEPVGGEPLMSVMRGQCDARPTVTRKATRPLAGTKLYCLVAKTCVNQYFDYITVSKVSIVFRYCFYVLTQKLVRTLGVLVLAVNMDWERQM